MLVSNETKVIIDYEDGTVQSINKNIFTSKYIKTEKGIYL